MSSVAQVPLARDDRCHPIVAVRMSLDGGVSWHEQQNRIEARFRRIAKDDLCMHAWEPELPIWLSSSALARISSGVIRISGRD
jgi:hypothetical protein